MIKKISVIICIFLLIPTISSRANNFTKPDFGTYPNLQIGNKEIHDFTEPEKVTYYYNIIGKEISFTVKRKKVRLSVKDVSYDGYGREYAIIEIGTSGTSPKYEYLYEKKPVIVKLFGEEIRITAESIIDHDNIEYLTIKGLIESIEANQSISKERVIEKPSKILEPKKEEGIDKINDAKIEAPKKFIDFIFIIVILNMLVLFFILVGMLKKRDG